MQGFFLQKEFSFGKIKPDKVIMIDQKQIIYRNWLLFYDEYNSFDNESNQLVLK